MLNLKHRWIPKAVKSEVSFYCFTKELKDTMRREVHYIAHDKNVPRDLSASRLHPYFLPQHSLLLGVYMAFCLFTESLFAQVSPAFSFLLEHSCPTISRKLYFISIDKSFLVLLGVFQFSSL